MYVTSRQPFIFVRHLIYLSTIYLSFACLYTARVLSITVQTRHLFAIWIFLRHVQQDYLALTVHFTLYTRRLFNFWMV